MEYVLPYFTLFKVRRISLRELLFSLEYIFMQNDIPLLSIDLIEVMAGVLDFEEASQCKSWPSIPHVNRCSVAVGWKRISLTEIQLLEALLSN